MQEQNSDFSQRIKNRFALKDNNRDFSNLFIKSDDFSDLFTILKVNFNRATLREASSFKKFMESSIAENEKNIIIDLNECEFIDSSFFGVLVSGLKRLKIMERKFYLIYDNKHKLPIFSTTGLDKVFTIFNTVEEAIEK